jgi:glycerol uptake facilitator-like aquaporin
MDRSLARAYLVELIGVFALVYFGAGIVCVNQLTDPPRTPPGTAVLHGQQPGLVGIALAQGLILAVGLAITMHFSGGFLNPAITIMLWVFNRLDSTRAVWLVGAQLVGAIVGGYCLARTFDPALVREARLGTPHLNALAFDAVGLHELVTGTAVELILTFFLTLAIFGSILDRAAWRAGGPGLELAGPGQETRYRLIEARLTALIAGLTMTACSLVGYPLTGSAANPARWFGTVFWEALLFEPAQRAPGPFADTFVYVAGPVVGALLAGFVYYRVMANAGPDARATGNKPADLARPAPAPVRTKK